MRELGSALRGSYPPLVTPFAQGEVDYDTFGRLVQRQVDGGSHGVVVTGTTGEPSMLSVEERSELVRIAVDVASGQLTVVAATGSASYDESHRLTVEAELAGADAVLVVTPYYARPPQRGLAAYFKQLAASTDLPVLLYHIPGRAAVGVDVATLSDIASSAENFVGMKHASVDLGLVTEALTELGPDFRIFVGLEELSLPMLAIGAAGVMNAVGNLAPRTVAELCAAVEAGDLEAARTIHMRLFELNRAVFWETNPIPMKYMMRLMGLLEANEHRLPMLPAPPELERRLDALVARVGLVTGSLP
jgi:4-hydroxy-tetrahydrodipicolinate synthase